MIRLIAAVISMQLFGVAPGVLDGKAADADSHPILDCHIHFYEVSKGVNWPAPVQKRIYRDALPQEYKAVAKDNGITGAIVIEANPTRAGNLRILELIKGDSFFKAFVPSLEIGSADFAAQLEELARNPLVVGIRGFLQSPILTVDEKQVADCRKLADQGMTLDIISRNTLNPKDKVEALAAAVPNLRIIIDHLGGAKDGAVDPSWESAIRRMAKHKNVYMKFSSFFDMYNPSTSEDNAWTSPKDLASYRAHFDVLLDAFGPDRLIFGSNWPVVDMGGDVKTEIALAEEYLKPKGVIVRDKIMYQNGRKFYSRRLPVMQH